MYVSTQFYFSQIQIETSKINDRIMEIRGAAVFFSENIVAIKSKAT